MKYPLFKSKTRTESVRQLQTIHKLRTIIFNNCLNSPRKNIHFLYKKHKCRNTQISYFSFWSNVQISSLSFASIVQILNYFSLVYVKHANYNLIYFNLHVWTFISLICRIDIKCIHIWQISQRSISLCRYDLSVFETTPFLCVFCVFSIFLISRFFLEFFLHFCVFCIFFEKFLDFFLGIF